MTDVSEIWAPMHAEVVNFAIDAEIGDWLLDELLLGATDEFRYCSLWQGETELEGRSGSPVKFALFVSAKPIIFTEDGRHVGRWRVDCGIIDEFGLMNGVHQLGYLDTLPEALKAIEAYIRKVSDS